MTTETVNGETGVRTETAQPSSAPASGSAASKRLTDRLAKVQDTILELNAGRSAHTDVEREIVWRLFGVISFWARNEHERTAAKARWLMAEIEDIVNERAKSERHAKRLETT